MLLLLAFAISAPTSYDADAMAAIAIAKAKRERVQQVEPVAKSGYPVRGSWWTGCSGWQHLASGEHIGKFPTEWLKSLTWAEVQSLHSDDHEGKVKWEYVPKSTTVMPLLFQSSTCPSGNCPGSTRRGISR